VQLLNPRNVRRTLQRLTTPVLSRAGLIETHFQREQRDMLTMAFGLVAGTEVHGDYLEFGVFKGDTFADAWEQARRHGQREMRFYAFDSFAGLPDPSVSTPDTGGEFVEGQFAYGRSDFERNLRRARVDMSRVTIVEGFYEDSLRDTKPADLGLQAASVVWIDCDLYSSTVCVLDFVTEVVVDGSVLVFDDWHCFRSRSDRGQQKACAEWLERNPAITLVPYRNFHWAGTSFVVNRDDA
jgi:hypothetical protein